MSQDFLKQVDELIRARYTLIYVLTWEETRAVRLLAQLAESQRKALLEWTVTDGLRPVYDPAGSSASGINRHRNAMKMLNEVLQAEQPAIYVLKDFHKYLDTPEIVRQMRDLGNALRQTRKNIVILAPELSLPRELDKAITVVDMPLPGYEELQALVKHTVEGARNSKRVRVNLSPAEEEALVKAAQGLTLTEAENALARAMVRDHVLDINDIQAVAEEKKQVIRKSGLLEYYEAGEAFEAVGGMDILKDWLRKRVMAFGEEARNYGLPAPRGVLLMGVQGCGKSLVAKCVSSAWRMPLLRMDVSRIFQGYVGSSEENMRKALAVAESLAPAVLWVDEIEKALSGIEGSSSTDGGTTARVVGQFLTVMQAVDAYTRGPAAAAGVAYKMGTLTPGKLADLVALDQDIFSIDPMAIPDTRVLGTMVGGRWVKSW